MDRDDAVTAFGGLLSSGTEQGLQGIRLLRSLNLENELTLFIDWHGGCALNGKSNLGIQLARAFSEFGRICHSAWELIASLNHAGIK